MFQLEDAKSIFTLVHTWLIAGSPSGPGQCWAWSGAHCATSGLCWSNCRVMGITCSLLQTVCGTADASIMCLLNTDLKGSCSVTSGSIYTVCTWSLSSTGGKDWCLDGGNPQALEPDRSVLNPSLPFTSLWPQSLMWVRWDISPWRPVNIHYLCFVIFMIATPHGCSHLLLLLTAQCVHGLEHWLCSKRAIWSLALFLMSDPCFCQMLGDRRNNHPFSVINVYCWIYCMHCIPNLTNEPNRW